MVVKEGYKITITDADGYIIGYVQLSGYDLDDSLDQKSIAEEIKEELPAKAFEE